VHSRNYITRKYGRWCECSCDVLSCCSLARITILTIILRAM
jgi:hypothetical protein